MVHGFETLGPIAGVSNIRDQTCKTLGPKKNILLKTQDKTKIEGQKNKKIIIT